MNTERITSGPISARVAFVGELLGREEVRLSVPLIGPSGQEFTRILAQTGQLAPRGEDEDYFPWLRRATVERGKKFFLTNVFHEIGPLKRWLCGKAEASIAYDKAALLSHWPDFPWPEAYSWEPVGKGGEYLHPDHLGVLPALKAELEALPNLNLIVPLGGVALWALTGQGGITAARGTCIEGNLVKAKLLPTLNPAAILRNWEDRTLLVADLMKVKIEAASSEISLPSRKLAIMPTLEDLDAAFPALASSSLICFDAEWVKDQIEMVGFAWDSGHAIVVPFIDIFLPGYSYWASETEEVAAWNWVRKVLALPTPKLAHNSPADVQVLWQKAGIPCHNLCEDSMYAHHALQPEMKKSLGFLASLYTSEASWKWLRKHDAKEGE